MSEDPRARGASEENLVGRNPELEESRRKAAEQEAELERIFLVQLMGNEMFRRWLMRQLVGFNTFTSPFGLSPTGFPQQEATQFQYGLKAAGWHLWEQFDNLDPEMASLMRREGPSAPVKAQPDE